MKHKLFLLLLFTTILYIQICSMDKKSKAEFTCDEEEAFSDENNLANYLKIAQYFSDLILKYNQKKQSNESFKSLYNDYDSDSSKNNTPKTFLEIDKTPPKQHLPFKKRFFSSSNENLSSNLNPTETNEAQKNYLRQVLIHNNFAKQHNDIIKKLEIYLQDDGWQIIPKIKATEFPFNLEQMTINLLFQNNILKKQCLKLNQYLKIQEKAYKKILQKKLHTSSSFVPNLL